jgi:BirA family transcriptional regulator, biotin operon repressor / biotin---[acetyl-CoA-carboxylase] ligase
MIIGSRFIFKENLDSTNAYAYRLLKLGPLPEGTVIHTNYQSAGKGQKGHSWESEDGKNLLFSIVLFPDQILPEDQFIISMMISLGICDFLGRFVEDCTVKWPNDIYVEYDKIAGILIENSISGNRIESTIAGIGLNINQEGFLSDAPNPVSLRMLTGKSYDIGICLQRLVADIDKRYKQLLSGKLSEIKKEYISSLYQLNEWHNYKTDFGILYGRIISVTDNGRLQIEDSYKNIHEFSFREVDFTL